MLLIHVDTYRLGEGAASTSAEAAGLGLDEIISDASLPDSHCDGAVIVIEWAERVADLLPADTLYITLSPVETDADARIATLTATGETSAALLRAIAPNE